MKHLIILRHAQAESAGGDFDRKLTRAGLRESRAAGLTLRKFLDTRQIPLPGLVLSSPAIRAVQTVQGIQQHLSVPDTLIRWDQTLYLPTVEQCLEALWGCGKTSTLVLCGHNPGVSALAAGLFRRPGILSPAGFVIGRLDIQDWSQLGQNPGELIYPEIWE